MAGQPTGDGEYVPSPPVVEPVNACGSTTSPPGRTLDVFELSCAALGSNLFSMCLDHLSEVKWHARIVVLKFNTHMRLYGLIIHYYTVHLQSQDKRYFCTYLYNLDATAKSCFKQRHGGAAILHIPAKTR